MLGGGVALFALLLVAGAQENGDLRLRDGSYQNGIEGGRVEIYLNEVWGTIDAGNDEEVMNGAAQTVCRQLGYDSMAYAGWVSLNGTNDGVPMLLENVRCDENELHILRCNYKNASKTSNPNHQRDLEVECNIHDDSVFPYNTQVRLVDGGSGYSSSGFLEIFLHGSWGPVCNMEASDAYAACRQLGYTRADAYSRSSLYNGNGEDKVYIFQCTIFDDYSCLRDCIGTSGQPECPFFHNIINCTFVTHEAKDAISGSKALCSPRTSTTVHDHVGEWIAIVLLALLIVVIVCIIVCFSVYCIPGRELFNTRKRAEFYKL